MMIKDYLKEHVLNNGQEKQALRGPEQVDGSTALPKEFLLHGEIFFQVVFIFDYSSAQSFGGRRRGVGYQVNNKT